MRVEIKTLRTCERAALYPQDSPYTRAIGPAARQKVVYTQNAVMHLIVLSHHPHYIPILPAATAAPVPAPEPSHRLLGSSPAHRSDHRAPPPALWSDRDTTCPWRHVPRCVRGHPSR